MRVCYSNVENLWFLGVLGFQVVKDATYGSEVGKAMAYYVLDGLLAVDNHLVFLSQLQSRGLLHSCLADISTNSYQV